MKWSVDPSVWVLVIVLGADVLGILLMFVGMARRRLLERLRRRSRRLVLDVMTLPDRGGGERRRRCRFVCRRKWVFLEEAVRINGSLSADDGQRRALQELLLDCRLHQRLLRDLRARGRYRRARAAAALSLFPVRTVLLPLVRALERERSHPVKILLAAALADIGDPAAVPTIIDTLKDAPHRYQQAIWGILADFDGGLEEVIPILIPRHEKAIQALLIHLAGRHCPPYLRRHIEILAEAEDRDLAHDAFRVLAAGHAEILDHRRFLIHDDFLIRNLAAESLGRLPRNESLALLFDHLDDPVIRKSACLAITALIRARPHFLKIVIYRCLNERRPAARQALADVLANFTDYLMGKLLGDEKDLAEKVIHRLVRYGKSNDIINFLNRNADAVIEEKSIVIIKSLLEHQPALSGVFLSHLNRRILGELGINTSREPAHGPKRREHANRPLLFFLFLLGAGAAPAASLILAAFDASGNAAGFLRQFMYWFSSMFAVYAFTLSSIYLLLLLVSIRGVRRQTREGTLARAPLLFKQNVLPSISIISPAYNEEATIVESVNALFNLRYPDYEIIVVNDGSSDRTLARLIEAFDLERTDVFIHGYLQTQKILGVYANKRYPELLVVDKTNGGKADSLNAGINVSRKEYFSGIDADSLIESDALLNMASLFLFSEHPVTAAGGNIFPANGCTVRNGALLETRIPKGHLARFQTIEYLRAFMAGRVGWAELRLLLIISGAFGVFHRRSVVNAGGYLTQSGRFQKDTVGEDMELVVRLCRTMRESRTPFALVYAHHANCWTEIPERLPILVNQRDRWQRGLLDIITYHSRLLFNPAYGRVGLVGFPYFLIFEVLGPWFELEGFLVFVVSLAAGWIGLPLVALVFTATVGLGVLMSILSLIIAERGRQYFPLRDKLKLLVYAVLENFGVRQLLNFIRLRGFVRILGKAEGWGKMERRGWRPAAAKGTGG